MKIIDKTILAQTKDTRIIRIEVASAEIAQRAQPGQFAILMVSEKGERIPLTIADRDPLRQTITFIFQEVGLSTKLLGKLEIGDSLYSLVGPLGHPTPIKEYGKVILIGGGVGIAEILPIVRALKEAKNEVYTILGARSDPLVILRSSIGKYSDKLFITTDDGSLGEKGFVTDALSRILGKDSDFQFIYCVGPVPMMKRVSEITKPYNIKTLVCLNAVMLDATGMCGSCRVTVGGKVRFCCVDGPDFDGHEVDFDELKQRQDRFIDQEQSSMRKHKCKLGIDRKK